MRLRHPPELDPDFIPLNIRYVERILNLLLWTRGGSEIVIGGCDALAGEMGRHFRPGGQQSFDSDVVARRVFLPSLTANNQPRVGSLFRGVSDGDFESVLVLGRMMSGPGGDLVVEKAREVMGDESSGLTDRIRLVTPDEKFKRHGQALAAASLPRIES